MSTNSSICMLSKDGKVKEIYCHWDGYVEYNGSILSQFYRDPERVKKLISLGALSSLGEVLIDEIVEKYGFDYYYNKDAKEEYTEDELRACRSTVAYHRDRGEELEVTEYKDLLWFFKSLLGGNAREFTYIYIEEENEWYLVQCYDYPEPEVNLRKIRYDESSGKTLVSEDFRCYYLNKYTEILNIEDLV